MSILAMLRYLWLMNDYVQAGLYRENTYQLVLLGLIVIQFTAFFIRYRYILGELRQSGIIVKANSFKMR